MLSSRDPVGSCPECATTIPEEAVLIEYVSSSGPQQFASCPGCRDVIHPR